MTPRKTLIVGAGITGAALARLLHDASRSLQFVGDVLVWEKNNIAGGRMMARSFRKNRTVHVDMGAQYLTQFTDANNDVREMLVQNQKLAVFEERQIQQDPTRAPPNEPQHHTVAHDALGFRSVVEYLLKDATLAVAREVERFEVLDVNRIKVTSTDGQEEIVHHLVLTCPIPNVLSILRNSAFEPAPPQLQALERVAYSQRIAVALLFDPSIAARVRELGWTSKYVAREEDSIVRYLCWDNLKKQQNDKAGFALLVHTGVPFGVEHMDDKDRNDEILTTILHSVHKLLPFLPEPEDAILHRWRMSQVTTPYCESDSEGSAQPSITLSTSPRIVVAGDAFLGSVFDNCLLSAKHAAATLVGESGRPTACGL